jgi:hypothetical protein
MAGATNGLGMRKWTVLQKSGSRGGAECAEDFTRRREGNEAAMGKDSVASPAGKPAGGNAAWPNVRSRDEHRDVSQWPTFISRSSVRPATPRPVQETLRVLRAAA